VGRRLAKLLHLNFFDTDQIIEERTGVSIGYIFEIEGEEGFRKRESKLLEEVSKSGSAVISTGGGVILKTKNRKVMHKYGQVVYLKASTDILWKRLKGCQNRPLLQTENPRQKIEQLLADRGSVYYEQADFVIEVASDSAAQTAQKIQKIISS